MAVRRNRKLCNMSVQRVRKLLVLAILFFPSISGLLLGDEPSKETATADAFLAGHSMHGEVFNEGPRQAAYLMDGMGNVRFEISSSQPEAKKFFNQGVAQLHGFWYYEAERSFRQASKLDPNCAICYWGMALANVNNRKRAEAFIAKAVDRKANASEREQMYIDSARRRFSEKVDGKKLTKKQIAENYTRDLEEIVLKYPDDVEARAFFALQLWENERNDLPIVSHAAINAVLDDVFDLNPMHPAHHYRIHLWDKRKPSEALSSAAQCGPSLPGIAHMWHMPGHTYSNLNRFEDAVWQQEASARVDHAHMMRDRIMPDQIHNFAHNNEWMIRNLLKVGRIKDSIALATNMIQLPRHPKFNTLNGGSAKYGRERLLQSLAQYRLWPELISAIESKFIEEAKGDDGQIELSRHLGIAHAFLEHHSQASDILQSLRGKLKKIESELKSLEPSDAVKGNQLAARPDSGKPPQPADRSVAASSGGGSIGAPSASGNCDDAPKSDDSKKAEANRKRREIENAQKKKSLEPTKTKLTEAIAAIEAVQAASAGKWDDAVTLFEKSGNWDKLLKVEWLAQAGKLDAALAMAQSEVKSNPNTLLPAAVGTFVRWKSKGSETAREEFEKLRELAATADLDTPILDRLKPLASELGYDASWAKSPQQSRDAGQRPPLDSLGPFRYSACGSPGWSAVNRENQLVSSKNYDGKNTLVIFYLGFGCLHCMEQLGEFSPVADKFREAGIEILAVSSETPEQLAKGLDAYTKPLTIPLFADPQLKSFKAFRCFDDFEDQPLHGTFLIDAAGNVLWQDISFEPFKDDEFLLKESIRLLKLKCESHKS